MHRKNISYSRKMSNCVFVIAIICCWLLIPFKSCSAAALDVAGELAGMAVDAASDALQDSDKSIVDNMKQQIGNDASHKQELSQYLEATRPELEARQQSAKKYMTGMVWSQQHIPLIGGLVSDGISSFFVWRYESALEDKADSDFLKNFVKLREHSIDANKGVMEIAAEMVAASNAGDLSQGDVTAKMAHIQQLTSHYGSAVAAMNEVFTAADIQAKPIDDGNIFDLIKHPAQETAEASETKEDTAKDVKQTNINNTSTDVIAKAQDAMKNFGIQDKVEATSYGDSNAGSLSIVRSSNGQRRLVALDKKNSQVAFVELTSKVYYLANKGPHPGPVILQVTILNDTHDNDAAYGVWNGNNHTMGIYSAYTVDASGNVVPGMLTSGEGANPSHYQGVLYEQKNVDLANLILTEMPALQADANQRGVKI